MRNLDYKDDYSKPCSCTFDCGKKSKCRQRYGWHVHDAPCAQHPGRYIVNTSGKIIDFRGSEVIGLAE